MVIIEEGFIQLVITIVLLLLCIRSGTFGFNSGTEESDTKCIERERQALLVFKQSLVDEYDYLSSWSTEEDRKDCCKWIGVHCSNRTGHIIKLDISASLLGGNITSSLLVLQHLNYLDLSRNNFDPNPIPEFIGSLTKLRFLDLSNAMFKGGDPSHLGNLKNLQSLNIGYNDELYISKLDWLSHLYKLEHLFLASLYLEEATNWLQVIKGLPSLFELKLQYSRLPKINYPSLSFVNSSKSLAHLDPSYCDLSNSAYDWLSNISSSLLVLDLSYNEFEGPIPDYAFWNMISLAHLDLSSNQITKISNFPFPINLLELSLLDNQLQGSISSYAFWNLTSLLRLDLSKNQIAEISKSFGDMCSLKNLKLSQNNLTGQLPNLFLNLLGCAKRSLESLDLHLNMLSGSLPDITEFSALRELDISKNRLDGSFPEKFGQPSSLLSTLHLQGNKLWGSLPNLSVFPSLRILNLGANLLNGTVSDSIGQLSQLEELKLYSNSLQGMITEAHLSNLSKLKIMDFSYNSIQFNFSPDWFPPFQLEIIYFPNCKLGPHFPKWLQAQKTYFELDISNTGISDTVPDWFWNQLSSNLFYLNVSHNRMKGKVPDLSLKFAGEPGIDLSFNSFEGSIQLVPVKTRSLILSENMFSGSISFLCTSLGDHLQYLDLSNNQLSGEIPDCWRQWQNLMILNLANNNFSGKIPDSVDSKNCSILSIHLRNNSFSGELPSFLKYCTDLKAIDAGNNNFTQMIPAWIGDKYGLQSLVILSLRSNKFYGSLSENLCNLHSLQLLDFSDNTISGTMPKCLNNLKAMGEIESSSAIIEHMYSFATGYESFDFRNYLDHVLLVWKRSDSEYKNILRLLKSIDLSSNKLSGQIPEEITNLAGLISLNLSSNTLTGPIPPSIGQLRLLNSLDLSDNLLTGKIPENFSQLGSLGVLDLSNNNLSGKIPSSTQLQSFDAFAYNGNPNLCGLPLPNKCPGEEPAAPPDPGITGQVNKDGIITQGFYITLVLGFIIGFWGVCGTLLLNSKWRNAYFRFSDVIIAKLYILIAVKLRKLQLRN